MGLFSYCFGGGSLVLIGAWETISAAYTHLNPTSSTPHPNTTTTITTTSTARTRRRRTSSAKTFSTITSIAVAFLSFLTIIDSSISSLNASRYHDRVGAALQLPTIAVSSIFLLYALAALLSNLTHFLPLPPSILNLIALFGFGQEFLLFYLQRKDPDGIENRYFDLLLVPISICVGSTLVELGTPDPNFLVWVVGWG
ncbi:transmembrane protein 45B [Cinnamomum micranthum f. kanehirae]|uniref:Transmembrane protein 45B n=1 Tax=Cinnamomum micranthum f. kanehirae TaxID=337451 RepID=A0A3S3NAF1_9MAGN|nr:transmembrane protein 45B [Cinnamomum micranthum f. kanehirae]